MPAHAIVQCMVLIALSSIEDPGESVLMHRHARVFAARLPNVGVLIKTQTKLKTPGPAGYISMGV